jgi:predicted transglutaminase-like cysteine proteinase
MSGRLGQYLHTAGAAAFTIAALLQAASAQTFAPYPQAATDRYTKYIAVGEPTLPPIGWVRFCIRNKSECKANPSTPREVVLTTKAWIHMVNVNDQANRNIGPMTSIEHWGEVERWAYPDDGKGDCVSYVLLKRRRLIQAGWPREALLITLVRDKKGDGHAVLSVKTDRGDFILDNEEQKILPWNKTGYRFLKLQSQSDPNKWFSLYTSNVVRAVSKQHDGARRQ